MSFDALKPRLHQGRPIVIDSDTCASLRGRGLTVDSPGAIGELLRQAPSVIRAHYQAEIQSLVNVLCAVTADTTPRALAEVGMEHRAALLTGLAVELAQEVAAGCGRPVAVAGVVGSERVAPVALDRLSAELHEHAARVASAGSELILARGQGSGIELMAAVNAALATELPVWAAVECEPGALLSSGTPVVTLLESLCSVGVAAVLFEVSRIEDGVALTERAREFVEGGDLVVGVLLAGGTSSVRGFPDESSDPSRWAAGAMALDRAGARIIGGGSGTCDVHTRALVDELRAIHPTVHPVRS